jgi:type III secretory pathway component EscS
MLLASDAAVIAAAVAGTFVVRAVTAVQQRHIDGDVRHGEAPGPAGA